MSQPLLLLHGALGSADLMRPLAQELENQGCRIHALNFSGHGGRAGKEAFTVPLFAQDVIAYRDEQQLSRVALFGFSMGGYVALYLASKHPERISQVFTLGTKFTWSPGIAAAEIRFLDPVKIKQKVPHYAEALARLHQPQDWEEVVRQTRQLLLGLGENPPLTREVLAQLAQPVVVGWGALDTMVSREESSEAAAHLPNGRFKVFPATPHPIEKVDTRMLATFLEEELH